MFGSPPTKRNSTRPAASTSCLLPAWIKSSTPWENAGWFPRFIWFLRSTAHKETVPLTGFPTPTGLYEWLVVAQGHSASPGWFIKVFNAVIKGLKQVVVYLDDIIHFYSDSVTHLNTIRALFEQLQA